MTEVTQLLAAANAGRPGAEGQLWEAVYLELRRIAGSLMSKESREFTLSGTALVHEAWLRLAGASAANGVSWEGRSHFFSAAAEAMRRILVDQARARHRQKRGGGVPFVPLEEATRVATPDSDRLLQVHDVLDDLARLDPLKATIVKLRYFVGFTHDEIAANLGLSSVTVRRHWQLARLWLYQALRNAEAPAEGEPVASDPKKMAGE